jgi:uncharacterized protein (TIGR02246 family)
MKHLPLFLLAAMLPASALAAPAAPQDRAALQALADSGDAAWNARDVDGMIRNFAAEGNLRLGGMAAPVQGTEALRAFFTQGFAARTGELRHVTSIDHVDIARPGLAVADGRVLIQRRLSDGVGETVREFANTTVAIRKGGTWKLAAIRGYPVDKPPAQAAGR